MADYTICVGMTGAGLTLSHSSGKRWQRAAFKDLYAGELDVRALTVSPHDPRVVWTGTEGTVPGEDLLHRSADAGTTFENVPAPIDGRQIWSIRVSPHDPDLVVVGTRPGGLLRTRDGGETWEELKVECVPTCRIGTTRMTSITFTSVPGEIWAGAEIGGLFHSLDDGYSWEGLQPNGGEQLLGVGEVWMDERHWDIHGLAATETSAGPAISAATPVGLFTSSDSGRTWAATRYAPDRGMSAAGLEHSMFYTRSVAAKADDPTTIFVGIGRRPPNHDTRGVIERSLDGGVTWAPVSPEVRSTVWCIATHPDLPDVLVAASLNGQLLTTDDGGESWRMLEHELGEIKAVALTPATA